MVATTLMNTAATGRPKWAPAVMQGKLLQEEHHGVRNRMNELGVGPHPWVQKRRRETRPSSTQSHRDQSPVHLSKRRRSGENTHFRRFSIDPQFPESRMGLTTKKMPADGPKTGHLP